MVAGRVGVLRKEPTTNAENAEALSHLVAEQFVRLTTDAIESRGLYAHINIVRYNPPSPAHGEEPPEDVLERNAAIFRTRLPKARVRVIPRVGFDVSTCS